MPNASIPLTSFTGGEWSPRLHGRSDIGKYSNACAVLQNLINYPHGGVVRRMGMEYIEDARTNNVRLIPFEYNREQAYVLEFTENKIRFYRNGAQIQAGGLPYEVVSPFSAADLPDISFTQSADVLYLVHEKHPPQKLSRTGPDTFGLSAIVFTGQPVEWTANNYPRAICFYQNRLVFAGSPNKPQTLWFSKTATYETLTSGTGGSDGMVVTISSNQVNAIQWLVASKKLLVGTTGGEWTVGDGVNAVTPSNIQAYRESNYGSKSGRVQLVGQGAIYASRDGRKLRDMSYSYQSDGFISPELSLLSEHLTRPGIREFDLAQNPDTILWCVMEDGSLAGLTYLKSEEVQGWHRHTTQGEVKSVCTIEGDTSTEVWFAVLRNGKVRIEKMPDMFEGDDLNDTSCAYLDSFLTYEGPEIQTLSGLEHLEGMDVGVIANGQVLPVKKVIDGKITLGVKATKVVVGLEYEWRLVPLRLEGGSPTGVSQGKKKRIESLVVRVERSAGINHRIPGQEKGMPLAARKFGNNFNEAVKLYTGDLPIKVQDSWDRDGQFELFGKDPLPVTILMIVAKVTVNE
nr:hypothetical protein BHI3_07640 [Bacteriovorax sp. HI3]